MSLKDYWRLFFLLVGFPLTVVGGIFGKNWTSGFNAPCRTKNIPREIPPTAWWALFVFILFYFFIFVSQNKFQVNFETVHSLWIFNNKIDVYCCSFWLRTKVSTLKYQISFSFFFFNRYRSLPVYMVVGGFLPFR